MIDRLQAQMQAMQMLARAQEVTANNMANINTPGYKGSKLFYRMFREQLDGKEVTRTNPVQQVSMQQGVLEPTGNDFDFAIKGDGFFVVNEGENSYLTRDGRFNINPEGYLVDSRGARVIGSAGAIYIPEYFQAFGERDGSIKLEVATDGTLRVDGEVYDKFKVVAIDDPSALERRGNGYFSTIDDRQWVEDETSTVIQGYYEKGNVEPLNEMVSMMESMRLFESQQRAMRSTDEMLGQAISRLGSF